MPKEGDLFAVIREVLGEDHLGSVNDAPLSLRHGVEAFDDCATIEIAGGLGTLVVGSDFIRGSEFYLYQLGLIGDRDLGRFLVAANLSDIAAMGAAPLFMTTNIRYPPTFDETQFRDILEAIRDEAGAWGCEIIGGDIGGFSVLVLSATAIGFTQHPPLLRSAAQPGDRIFYLGPLGVAGSAVLYFRNRRSLSHGLDASDEQILLKSWTSPMPQLSAGAELGRAGIRIACQDNSDGVKTTIEQICEASRVGAHVDERLFSPAPIVERVASSANVSAYHLSLSGSVDFGLVFTLPREFEPPGVLSPEHQCIQLGEITPEADALRYTDRQGIETIGLPGIKWEHQDRPIDEELLRGRG